MEHSEPQRNWEEIAIWLADCEATTTQYLLSLTHPSKSELRRHKCICEILLWAIRDNIPILRPSKKESVIERLEESIEIAKRKL